MIRLAQVIAVAVLLAALVAALTAILGRAELATIDARFDVRGTQPVSGLAVVGIDERSFSQLNVRWPFRRTLHAELIDRLKAAGVRQIVYDVQFTEPSEDPDDDDALFEAVSRAGDVVLATGEVDDQGRTRVLGGDEQLAQAGGARAAASTFPTDHDGTIRRVAREDTHLETIAALIGRRFGHPMRTERALIDFPGPRGTIPTFSFADVHSGAVGARELRGKIVVVGATAPGLQDVHTTSAPGNSRLPGAEIQAGAIRTALQDTPLQEPPGWATFVIALLLGGIGVGAVRWLGPIRGSAAVAGVGVVYVAAAQLAFNADVVLTIAVPLITLAVGLTAALLWRAVSERTARRRVSRLNAQLEAAVHARTKDLAATQLDVVLRLARAAELHDDDTGEHIERMSHMCGEVALELGLSLTEAETIRYAAVLHDVGKIGVPDAILRKPGGLTANEMATMRKHVMEGAQLLDDSSSPILRVAEVIVLTHHERWDGTGYPNGLRGEEIPLEGRIGAVCDVYDALIHVRPYKEAWSVERACAEIERLRGTHFDPAVADALLTVVRREAAEAGTPLGQRAAT